MTARGSSYAMQKPKIPASLTNASLSKVGAIQAPIGPGDAWQKDAYAYEDVIGEVHNAISITAAMIGKCSIRPVEDDDSVAVGGWKETADKRALRVWEAFVPPSGGKPDLFRRAAGHLQIGGESFLLGSAAKDEFGRDAGIVWEFLSPLEIKAESGGKSVKRNYGGYGGQSQVDVDPDSYLARLHRKDLAFSDRPDSSLKHVLPICAEIVALTQLVDATIKSRLSAGIFFVPDEMSFGPYDETEEDADNTDDIDPLTEELTEHLKAPVEDRTSAASLVPLIMRGPAELGDKMTLIELSRDLEDAYRELRAEAIGRLAAGLDVPREMIEGMGGLNHWSSYNIDASLIDKHIKPLGQLIAEFLTSAYLRPMLVEFEGMTEDEAMKYRLLFDSSKMTSRTDTGPTARHAFQMGEISRVAFLRESGLDEADAPSEEERKERDLRDLMTAEPVIFGPQIIGMLYPELEGVIKLPSEIESQEGGPDPENPTGLPQRGNHTGPSARPVIDNETGQDEPEARGPAGPRQEDSLIDRLATGADAALERALERAGNRLLSKMNGSHVSMKDRVKHLPKGEVLFHVSEADLRALKMRPADLFADAWDEYVLKARRWLQEHFINEGCDTYTSDEKAQLVASTLAAMLEAHLASGVSRPIRVGSNGLRVQTSMIEQAFAQHERIVP